jgi:hypothetical protein
MQAEKVGSFKLVAVKKSHDAITCHDRYGKNDHRNDFSCAPQTNTSPRSSSHRDIGRWDVRDIKDTFLGINDMRLILDKARDICF